MGKLIATVSRIPKWFPTTDRLESRLSARLLAHLISDTVTLESPAGLFVRLLRRHITPASGVRVRKRRWLRQYGYEVPWWLTPTMP